MSLTEVPEVDFGDAVDDPWFRFDGDTLLTHADFYVSGSGNHLYLNGTDSSGTQNVFYFDIDGGILSLRVSGSV